MTSLSCVFVSPKDDANNGKIGGEGEYVKM
jgi:hypothetical protein